MVEIYCVKCKTITENIDEYQSITKNKRPILKAKCAICKSTKNRFLKLNKSGGDIVSSVISQIPVELHLRTLRGKKYSFCGPNTNLNNRLSLMTPQKIGVNQ